jgi:hypothetical protein
MLDFKPLICAVLSEGIVTVMCVASVKMWRIILHDFQGNLIYIPHCSPIIATAVEC